MPGDLGEADADQLRHEGEAAAARPQEMHRLVYVEREHQVSRFHGDLDQPWRVEEFREDLERAWSSIPAAGKERRLEVLLRSVGRHVRQEIDCLGEEDRRDPDAILSHLREVYGERRSATQLTAAFFGVRQRQGEGVVDYSHRLVAAARAAQKKATTIDDALLCRHFVEGLQDRTLARILVRELDAQSAPNFQQIRKQALQWCGEDTQTATAAALQYSSSRPPHSTTSIPPPPPAPVVDPNIAALAESIKSLSAAMTEGFKSMQEQMSASQKRPSFRDHQGRLLCFKCSQPGHLQKDCKSKSGN